MKREAKSFSLLIVTILMVTQLLALAPVAQAAQGNRSRTRMMRRIPPPSRSVSSSSSSGIQGNRWCFRRCRREYARCLNWAGGNRGRRRACAVRYRRCLNRCS